MPRPPKPPELRKLEGSPNTLPPDRGVDFERVHELPPPPDFLGPRGQEVWREIGKRLMACKLLQEPDLYSLSVLCAMQEHVEHVFRKANGDHPQEISAAHITSLRQLYGEFGMTPASRRKVPSNADQSPQNPFAKFKPHFVA